MIATIVNEQNNTTWKIRVVVGDLKIEYQNGGFEDLMLHPFNNLQLTVNGNQDISRPEVPCLCPIPSPETDPENIADGNIGIFERGKASNQ